MGWSGSWRGRSASPTFSGDRLPPLEYAAAGIPEYWIVDEHETDQTDGMISMFRLELTDQGPRYQLRQRVSVREPTGARG